MIKVVALSLTIILIAAFVFSSRQPGNPIEGIEYEKYTIAKPRQDIHVIKIKRSLIPQEISLDIRLSPRGLLAASTVGEIIASESKPVIAAANGTLFGKSGVLKALPRGPIIAKNEAIRLHGESPTHPSIGINSNGDLWLDTFKLHASISTEKDAQLPIKLNDFGTEMEVTLFTSHVGTMDKAPQSNVFSNSKRQYILAPAENSSASLEVSKPTKLYTVSEIRSNSPLSFTKDEALLSIGDKVQIDDLQVGDKVSLHNRVETKAGFGSCSLPSETFYANLVHNVSSVSTAILYTEGDETLLAKGVIERQQFKHPRSALCWNEESLYLVAADGIRFSWWGLMKTALGFKNSSGIAIGDLAKFLRTELSCECAVALDGGKSSTLYLGTKLVNSPASGHEWPINPAFVVTKN